VQRKHGIARAENDVIVRLCGHTGKV
jgi:hypothetical protein